MGKTETKLVLITNRSREHPKEKFTSLAHLLNSDYLYNCWKELKNGKAPGIDGKTKESYSPEEIKIEIIKTVAKMKAKRYRPKPVKRVYIESPKGKIRPLGLPVLMDKIVQQGMKKILEAIFEPEFLELSYGFRPNRNCHQALKELYKMVMTKPLNWIIDVDIKGFFENRGLVWNYQKRKPELLNLVDMLKRMPKREGKENQKHLNFLDLGIIAEGQGRETS